MPKPDDASEAFTKVVANGFESAIGLTADGRVETFGTNFYAGPPLNFTNDNVPTELAGQTVVDIAGSLTGHGDGMAVTSTGGVYRWSTPADKWNDNATLPAPDQLQGAKAVAISPSGTLAAVVKQDGSVLVWGSTTVQGDFGQKTHQDGLTGVTSVTFSSDGKDVYALKSDGTLVAWGANDATPSTGSGQTDLPSVTTDTTDGVDVTEVASAGASAVALLSNGQLTAWGQDTAPGFANAVPTDIAGKQIVALAASTSVYFAVDSDGGVYAWGSGTSGSTWQENQGVAFAQLPEGVDPANFTGLSANDYYATAIQATYGYIAKPTVSGTPKVGETLTATPATFTATPDADPARQWLADGNPIAGATGTTYTLTTAEIGKRISYSETATHGTETATANSDPTAAVVAASTGGGNTITPPTDHHQQLAQDQAQLQKAQTKLKKAKKALKKAKKAHNAAKAKKLKKKVKKLKKLVKADKKLVQADQ